MGRHYHLFPAHTYQCASHPAAYASELANMHDATWIFHSWLVSEGTVYPKKYAHGFVVLCFVVVMQSFLMNSHEVFIHIHQGCFAGTGAIVRLPQCQWSKPDRYGKISQCITTTKHSKAKTVCIFLRIYCMVSPVADVPNTTSYSLTAAPNRWCTKISLSHRADLPQQANAIWSCAMRGHVQSNELAGLLTWGLT